VRQRLRDIGDAALEIEDCLHGTTAVSEEPRAVAAWPGWIWVSVIATVLAAVGWWFAFDDDTAGPGSRVRASTLSALLPDGVTVNHGELPSVAISPDGRWIVFVGSEGRATRLYLRALDSTEAQPIPDTEGAVSAVFSPDGRWIAFLQGNELMRVAVSGGAPSRIAGVTPVVRGLDWNRPEEIILTPSKRAALFGATVADGAARPISTLDPESSEVIHNWAQELPDGREILITVVNNETTSYDDAKIFVLDTKDGSKKLLVDGGYHGSLLPNDILVYVRAGELLAQRVDTQRWETLGPVVPVLDGFMTDANSGSLSLDFSDDGMLVYAPGEVFEWQSGQLVWVDRDGHAEPALEESRPFRYPALSPDGMRAVFTIEEINDDIWIYEFERDSLTRLTFEDRNMAPIWRPGHEEICYSAVGPADEAPQIYAHSTDGRTPRRRMFEDPDENGFCGSWSPDGSTLSYMHFGDDAKFDIKTVGNGAAGDPVPFLETRFAEYSSRFSPDGKWIAYTSDESGRLEIYIQPFPGPGRKWKISTDGGVSPVWHSAGTELFYLEGTRMMAVEIRLKPEVSIGRARSLFDGNYSRGRLHWVPTFDVSPDGERFLMILRDEVPEVREIRVVQDWFRDVEAKLDAAGG
jgi:Tol biopolymer transport system component